MSHQLAVRDLGPAGSQGAADRSVAAAGSVGGHPPAQQPGPAALGLVGTGHLPVVTLSLVLAQPGSGQLHLAALLAVLASHGDLVQQSLGKVQPSSGLQSAPALRTLGHLGPAGTADDVTLQAVLARASRTLWLTYPVTLVDRRAPRNTQADGAFEVSFQILQQNNLIVLCLSFVVVVTHFTNFLKKMINIFNKISPNTEEGRYIYM